MAKVTVYTTKMCSACRQAKEFLKARGVGFQEISIDDDKDMQQKLFDETGHLTMPIMNVDGKYIVGFDKLYLSQLLGFW